MKILAIITLAMLALGCTSKIYQTDSVTCTWSTVEQLIICRGENP